MGSARRTPIIFPWPTNCNLPRHPSLIVSPWVQKHLAPAQAWERVSSGGLLLGRFPGTAGVWSQQQAHPPAAHSLRTPRPSCLLPGWGPRSHTIICAISGHSLERKMGVGLSGDPLAPGPVKTQVRENEDSEAPTQETPSSMCLIGLLTLCGSEVSREVTVGLRTQLASRIFCTQGMSLVTRAYTPGMEVEQVLLPQDTMPTRVQAPSFWQTRGPPESPCREREGGLDLAARWAQPGAPGHCSRDHSRASQPVDAQHMHIGGIMKGASAAPSVICVHLCISGLSAGVL